jgi:hypothetical protein
MPPRFIQYSVVAIAGFCALPKSEKQTSAQLVPVSKPQPAFPTRGIDATIPVHPSQIGVFRLSERCSSRRQYFRAEPRMNQFTFVVLTVLGLSLAGYFGLAAWRVSDGQAEITGTILPSHR